MDAANECFTDSEWYDGGRLCWLVFERFHMMCACVEFVGNARRCWFVMKRVCSAERPSGGCDKSKCIDIFISRRFFSSPEQALASARYRVLIVTRMGYVNRCEKRARD